MCCANHVYLLFTNSKLALGNQSLVVFSSETSPMLITRQHNSDDCIVCKIYKGQKGVKRKAGNPIIDTNPLARVNQNTWDRQTPVKCRKCTSIMKIRICAKRNSVQNIVDTLNRKGLSDAVVSTILRQRAASSMSNVIPLLGYGSMPMKVKILKQNETNENNIFTRDEIIQLQRELKDTAREKSIGLAHSIYQE